MIGVLVVTLTMTGWVFVNVRLKPSTPAVSPVSTLPKPTPTMPAQPYYRDPVGQVKVRAFIDIEDLQVGDCVYEIPHMGDTIYQIGVVPCSHLHGAEVFAVNTNLLSTDYDSQWQFCRDAFGPYVGIDREDSKLFVSWIAITDDDAPTVLQCLVHAKGKMVTKSYKGSKR